MRFSYREFVPFVYSTDIIDILFVLIAPEFILIYFLFCFQSDLDIESSKGLSSDEMKTFWKSVDLAKLQLPAGIDINNVEVKVDKVVVDVNRFHYF